MGKFRGFMKISVNAYGVHCLKGLIFQAYFKIIWNCIIFLRLFRCKYKESIVFCWTPGIHRLIVPWIQWNLVLHDKKIYSGLIIVRGVTSLEGGQFNIILHLKACLIIGMAFNETVLVYYLRGQLFIFVFHNIQQCIS